MAYADNRGTGFNPASITAAVAVNGAFLAVLMLSVPQVRQHLPSGPMKFIDIFQPPAPSPPETHQQAKPATKTATIPQTVTTKTAAQASTNDLNIDAGFTLPQFPAGDLGTITELPVQPPAHNPVEIAAKLNPRYAADLQPSYPPAMLRQEIEGAVTVRVLIGTDGRVKLIEPVRASEGDFLKVTRDQALRKWRFTPATRDGAPVESWKELTVRFEMPD